MSQWFEPCAANSATPGSPGLELERLAGLRAEALAGFRLYELRHGEAISQAELAGKLEVT